MVEQRVTRSSVRLAAWSGWVVVALLMLPWFNGLTFAFVVFGTAVALGLIPGMVPAVVVNRDRAELVVICGLYVGVTALLWLAFRGFGTDQVLGLFLSFAAALLLGVVGPVVYTVWMRRRSLADLGLQAADLRGTGALALLFAGVQFALTMWGFQLPAAEDWVPLLVMALVVGAFESVFFRGFIQNRLEAQFGHASGIGAAAVLYGMYHVGYGMGFEEIAFLSGLGVIYAVAFSLTRSLLVLWPLLTPLGSFFANVRAGDIELPWASIAGFLDVLGVMLLVGWLAHRHVTSRPSPAPRPLSGRLH